MPKSLLEKFSSNVGGYVKKDNKKPSVTTMGQLKREFILSREGKGDTKRTIDSYEKHFNCIFDFFAFYCESERDDIERLDIKVLEIDNIATYYHNWLRDVRQVSEQTIITRMRHFKAIVYYAQENKWVIDYPIHIKAVEPDIKPTFTDHELERLVAKKPSATDTNFVEYRNWAIIKLLIATGMRVSSLLALDVDDVDFERKAINVNRQKNRTPQIMEMEAKLQRVLSDYIYYYRRDERTGDSLAAEPLFCNTYGERLSYTGARDSLRDYFEKRSVVWAGFHKFRHTYATKWVTDGGDAFTLKNRLGHTSLAMTNRYVNLYGNSSREQIEEHSLINKIGTKSGRKKIRKFNSMTKEGE